jgi:hypothetical protein
VSEKANNMERTGEHLDHSSPKDDQKKLQKRSYSEYHPAKYYPVFQSFNFTSDVDFSCLEQMLEAGLFKKKWAVLQEKTGTPRYHHLLRYLVLGLARGFKYL